MLIGQGPYYNPPMRTNRRRGPEGRRLRKHTGYTTDIITDLALDWLKNERDADKPFLLMYQHKAPHRNWQPGPKYLTRLRRRRRFPSRRRCSTTTPAAPRRPTSRR